MVKNQRILKVHNKIVSKRAGRAIQLLVGPFRALPRKIINILDNI